MKFTFRPTTRADLPQLSALLQRAFDVKADAPFLEPSFMAWKYWDHRQDWVAPRGYVLEGNGSPVAHAGIWPVTFETAGHRSRGIHMTDWASAQDFPGAGLALVYRLAEMFDFICMIGGSQEARGVLKALGFVDCAHVWRAARPLRPLRQIATHQSRNLKLAPRLARNWVWARLPNNRLNPSWKATEIISDEIPRVAWEASWCPRPWEFFDYLRRCPTIRYSLYAVRNAGEFEGFFALGLRQGQAHLAGIWMNVPEPELRRIAYCLAQQAATRTLGACEITALETAGPSGEAAVQAGMRVRQVIPVCVLNRKGQLAPTQLQCQMSDPDALFLDTRQTNYWT